MDDKDKIPRVEDLKPEQLDYVSKLKEGLCTIESLLSTAHSKTDGREVYELVDRLNEAGIPAELVSISVRTKRDGNLDQRTVDSRINVYSTNVRKSEEIMAAFRREHDDREQHCRQLVHQQYKFFNTLLNLTKIETLHEPNITDPDPFAYFLILKGNTVKAYCADLRPDGLARELTESVTLENAAQLDGVVSQIGNGRVYKVTNPSQKMPDTSLFYYACEKMTEQIRKSEEAEVQKERKNNPDSYLVKAMRIMKENLKNDSGKR